MDEVGTTERQYALAKVAASKHGALNPNACFKKEYTVEDVLNSPMVCDPLRLFEICAARDGAAAVILCSKEKAKMYTNKPVAVAGVGIGSCLYGDPTLTVGKLSALSEGTAPVLSESYTSSRIAYEQAGVGPEDVDFVELPDNSSWHYLAYLDCLGFTQPGEAETMLETGDTVIGGKLPVCPSGGISSHGEAVAAQGLLQVVECVTQLQGRAGARQVEDARVGMAHTEGFLGNAGTAIFKI
jgi:acetyl-CoA acetyltransferase